MFIICSCRERERERERRVGRVSRKPATQKGVAL